MLFGQGLLGFLVLVLWIYALLDVIATDSSLCRNLPKMAWLLLVVVLPAIGAVTWLILGRPVAAGWRPGDTQIRTPRRRVVGLEDSDTWSSSQGSRPSRPPAASTPPPKPPPMPSPSPTSDAAESDAARERRLMEWEAELRRREEALRDQPPDEAPPS